MLPPPNLKTQLYDLNGNDNKSYNVYVLTIK